MGVLCIKDHSVQMLLGQDEFAVQGNLMADAINKAVIERCSKLYNINTCCVHVNYLILGMVPP